MNCIFLLYGHNEPLICCIWIQSYLQCWGEYQKIRGRVHPWGRLGPFLTLPSSPLLAGTPPDLETGSQGAASLPGLDLDVTSALSCQALGMFFSLHWGCRGFLLSCCISLLPGFYLQFQKRGWWGKVYCLRKWGGIGRGFLSFLVKFSREMKSIVQGMEKLRMKLLVFYTQFWKKPGVKLVRPSAEAGTQDSQVLSNLDSGGQDWGNF